ncbi:MAG: GNAT family N-acetyltransferase [Bacteroidia bacterium]
MSNWIPVPAIHLTGETIDLIPLDIKHFSELEMLAKDKRIWEFYPFDCSNSEKFRNIYKTALTEKDAGNQYPFVIFHKKDNRIIGSTRFLEMQQKHRKLEIGATWVHPDYWGTAVNQECKLLLLTYSFETLQAIRIQLKTNEKNIRSCKAIEKIGGKLEGILRHDMLCDNGTKRNSAYFSIIDSEWKEKKLRLEELYRLKKHESVG